MSKKTPYDNISAEDAYKGNVKIEKGKLTLYHHVLPSFIWEFKNVVQKEVKVVYSEGKKLKCPVCDKILNRNGYHPRLLNKVQLIELQKYKCSKKGRMWI